MVDRARFEMLPYRLIVLFRILVKESRIEDIKNTD